MLERRPALLCLHFYNLTGEKERNRIWVFLRSVAMDEDFHLPESAEYFTGVDTGCPWGSWSGRL